MASTLQVRPALMKLDLQKYFSESKHVHFELGCGPRRTPGAVGIDFKDLPEVDIVADLNHGLPFVPDNCADEISSSSFLEHIDNLDLLMREIHRVLKPTGKFTVFVPHFSNPFFYSDYTHKRFFGLYTFFYFVKEEHQMRRKVPDYYSDFYFRVTSIRLEFSSEFGRVHFLKQLFARFINSSPKLQEFYEENLVYWFPCYGVRTVLVPEK